MQEPPEEDVEPAFPSTAFGEVERWLARLTSPAPGVQPDVPAVAQGLCTALLQVSSASARLCLSASPVSAAGTGGLQALRLLADLP